MTIVDRPAPTSAPTPGLDLDALEQAERAMTLGPWSQLYMTDQEPPCEDYPTRAVTFPAASIIAATAGAMLTPTPRDAAGIVALRNAAPALIAEVRALRAEVEVRRSGRDPWISKAIDLLERGACEQRTRIATLERELATARAVPADVEAAILTYGCASGEGRSADALDEIRTSRAALRATIARAIAEARQPATVGGQETAPVVVDSDDSAAASLIVAQRWGVRMDDGDEIRWCDSEHDARLNFAQHVAHDRHDHAPDPATRGPLRKGG